MAGHLSNGDYCFSFQMQSLFDASIDGLPHFIYTDHTHLTNLQYPGFDRKKLFPNSIIDLEKQIYDNATLVFTRSTNVAKSVVEDYGCPAEKVICVYAGSNTKANAIENNQNYTNKNILFVGIDWERKGGPNLIEAFKR